MNHNHKSKHMFHSYGFVECDDDRDLKTQFKSYDFIDNKTPVVR